MSEKELTFWDHLDELRRVLFRVLGVWFVLAIGYFIAMPYLFDNVILKHLIGLISNGNDRVPLGCNHVFFHVTLVL